ncbi:SWIM zinc finger family protein [Aquisphaera insulae]|uniref:SWIM zinc finger family protein n=1 Tax=Aquisphaera insulae TaxID=2712864 RepID=UPI0013EE355F|nr:SWIM zinc finger family protein [Aquisphaera insulae]
MITITEDFVDAAAPNADAAKNGRALVLKKKFLSLNESPDQTLLFGQCAGSGKTPYLCSADFAVPEKPVYRCNCPSRQFPCKHALGLLYARADGKPFATADVPEEIAAKREKVAARVEKKKADAEKPVTVNKSALAKKIKAQLDGVDLLEKLVLDVVRLGIGNVNAKTARELEEQARQLGNAYLPGAQAALHGFTKLFRDAGGEERTGAGRESVYGEALDQLCRLHALIRKGRAYLRTRLDDPELAPETDTGIAAWLGHAWQLRELKDAGLVEPDVELVQLSFHSYDDVARKEYVDAGVWMDLGSGRIALTQTYRPYQAARHIKSEDSFAQVAQVKELCIYPGDLNPRVRWDGMLARPIESRDLVKVRGHGRAEFAAVVKDVKSVLKDPLADKYPICALSFRRIGAIGKALVVEDRGGGRLVMTDVGLPEEPRSVHLLSLLPEEALRDQTLIVRFRHDLDTRKLQVKPLSIVTESEVIRLTL